MYSAYPVPSDPWRTWEEHENTGNHGANKGNRGVNIGNIETTLVAGTKHGVHGRNEASVSRIPSSAISRFLHVPRLPTLGRTEETGRTKRATGNKEGEVVNTGNTGNTRNRVGNIGNGEKGTLGTRVRSQGARTPRAQAALVRQYLERSPHRGHRLCDVVGTVS